MEWAVSFMLNNPEALVKARAEIDAHVGQSRLIEESDLPKLLYLRGVIYETLRMCPSDPLLVPHESKEECTVGGFRVPRGAMLLVNAWAVQNDPAVWTQLERFRAVGLGGKKEQGFTLFPFGLGRRGCPG